MLFKGQKMAINTCKCTVDARYCMMLTAYKARQVADFQTKTTDSARLF